MEMFLSVADASRILGVTTQTVRLMIRRGDLPVAARTEGGIHLFRRADVEGLASQRAMRGERRDALTEQRARTLERAGVA